MYSLCLPLSNKPCSTAELFKFGWTLYIHIKGVHISPFILCVL